jgi:hypothetical protein
MPTFVSNARLAFRFAFLAVRNLSGLAASEAASVVAFLGCLADKWKVSWDSESHQAKNAV